MTAPQPYAVTLLPSAQRALSRLPQSAVDAALELIFGALAEEPYRVGRPLMFELEGRYSARRGEYRVIYRIDEPSRSVVVQTIAHRRDAYRRR